MAVSLAQILGHPIDRGTLCARVIAALESMYENWCLGEGDYLARYRADCITLGKPVRLLRGDMAEDAFAEDIDESFGLIVRHGDGRRETVTAGEVSVRGLWGYAD